MFSCCQMSVPQKFAVHLGQRCVCRFLNTAAGSEGSWAGLHTALTPPTTTGNAQRRLLPLALSRPQCSPIAERALLAVGSHRTEELRSLCSHTRSQAQCLLRGSLELKVKWGDLPTHHPSQGTVFHLLDLMNNKFGAQKRLQHTAQGFGN